MYQIFKSIQKYFGKILIHYLSKSDGTIQISRSDVNIDDKKFISVGLC